MCRIILAFPGGDRVSWIFIFLFLFLLWRPGRNVFAWNFCDLVNIIMRVLVIPPGSLQSRVRGSGAYPVIPWPIRQCCWKSGWELSAGTASLTGGPVRDFDLVFRFDASPCLLLPVPHVEEEMGHLYFGKVKFLLGAAFPRFWSSFDGSAGFWQTGIRRISVIGKINSWYVRFKHGPMGTGWRDSIRKAGEACFLSNILLAGGQ